MLCSSGVYGLSTRTTEDLHTHRVIAKGYFSVTIMDIGLCCYIISNIVVSCSGLVKLLNDY